jgi:hypothetical protein
MVDQSQQFKPENVQWVDVSGENPQPKKSKNIPWKRLLIFILIVVVGLILVIIFVRSIFPVQEKADNQRMVNDIAEAEADCQNAEDVEKCLLSVRLMLVSENGNGDYCKDLQGEEFDSCINLAALSSENRGLCKEIEDEEVANDCADALFLVAFGRDHSYQDCSEYNIQDRQESCESNWIRGQVLAVDCSSEYVDDNLCAYGEIIQQARAIRDLSLCEQITNSTYYGGCIELVGETDLDLDGLGSESEAVYGTSDTNTDSDGDGLGDYEEVSEHKTDPANADTDGDGFNDKIEVDNKFDPLN